MEWSNDEINGAITVAAKVLGFSTLTREQTLVLQKSKSKTLVWGTSPFAERKGLGTSR